MHPCIHTYNTIQSHPLGTGPAILPAATGGQHLLSKRSLQLSPLSVLCRTLALVTFSLKGPPGPAFGEIPGTGERERGTPLRAPGTSCWAVSTEYFVSRTFSGAMHLWAPALDVGIQGLRGLGQLGPRGPRGQQGWSSRPGVCSGLCEGRFLLLSLRCALPGSFWKTNLTSGTQVRKVFPGPTWGTPD